MSTPKEDQANKLGGFPNRRPIRLMTALASPRHNRLLQTPNKRNRLNAPETSFSPVRASMEELKRSLTKMAQKVSAIERKSPHKRSTSERSIPRVDLKKQFSENAEKKVEEVTVSSDSSSPVESTDSSDPSQLSSSSSSSNDSLHDDSPMSPNTEPPMLDQDLLEGLDTILNDFVQKACQEKPINISNMSMPEESEEQFLKSKNSKKIGLKLFKPNETVVSRKNNDILVHDSDEDSPPTKEKTKVEEKKKLSTSKDSCLEQTMLPPKNSRSPLGKSSIFKNRQSVAVPNTVLCPDSDEEEQENSSSRNRPRNFAEKQAKEIFSKRQTLRRKDTQVLVEASDDENEDDSGSYAGVVATRKPDQKKSALEIFSKRQTLCRKATKVLAGDSDEEKDNDNRTQIDLQKQVMTEESEDDAVDESSKRKKALLRNETVFGAVQTKSPKDKKLKMKVFVPEKSPTRVNLMEQFNFNASQGSNQNPDINGSKKRNDRKQMSATICKECNDYYSTRNLTEDQLAKLIHQCSRHRDTFYHKPTKVPDDYFDIDFSTNSPTKTDKFPTSRSKTLKPPTKSENVFKLPMPVRVKSLERTNKAFITSKNVFSKTKLNNINESIDKHDYEAWKAGLKSPDKRVLNSTQISLASTADNCDD